MTKNINFVSHKKSKVKVNGKPQLPSASALVEGEIAVNYAKDVETLSIKNESGTVVTFSSDNYYTEQKLGSGFTSANSAKTVTDVIEENERTVTAHTANTSIHLTTTEKTNIDSLATNIAAISGITSTKVGNWNTAYGKVSGITASTTAINSLTGSVGTMAFKNANSYSSATEVNTALSGKSNTGHTHDDRYYTESELTGSSTTVVVAKAASATTAASAAVANSVALSNVTGADDLKAIEAITGISGLLKKTAANKWSLDTNSYSTTAVAVTGATYNTTNKTIDLKNAAGTVVSTVDATAFIKDGMVSNVEVKDVASSGTCLVITFNTDAGKDAINIPISQIFDASNYYTKADLTGSSTTVVVAKASSATTAASAGSVALSNVSGADDLKAIEALTGTSGLLKKTAANTWALDTTSYSSATQVNTALGNKVDKVSGKGLSTNDYTTDEKNKLSGIAAGAEVNQNAFSNIKVGTTTVAADGKTDTLEISGSGIINITADVTNDKITISASNAVTSVAGKTGAVTLVKGDVGLGNVDNTADANKKVASAATAAVAESVTWNNVSGKPETYTPSAHNQASNTITAMTGYAKASTAAAIASGDTLNAAIGKLEKALDGKQPSGSYVTTGRNVSTGAGLVGGGNLSADRTIKAALSSETKSSLSAASMGSTANRQYAVGLDANGVLSVNVPWTNTNNGYVPTGRTITAASGLTGGGNLSADRTISLATTGTAGTYGPTADVTGSNNTTIKVPQITTDAYGRVTAVTERTYTSVDHTYTVNNGTFTISGNGTAVASTSANASANTGLNIKGGSNVTVSTGTNEITIAATDTTYSAGTAAQLSAGTNTYDGRWSAKNLKTGLDALYQPKGSYVTTARTISTASGLTGGGNLSANLTIGHSNNITAGSAKTSSSSVTATPSGANIAIPVIEYDAQGHIKSTGSTNVSLKVNTAATSTAGVVKIATITGTNNSDTVMTQSAVTKAIEDSFAAQDAMVYKGLVGSGTNYGFPTTFSKGYTYKVATAFTADSVSYEIGDMFIANTDVTTAENYTKAHWDAIQTNLDPTLYVNTARTITTASGLTGGGNLSANRTIGLAATGTSGTYGPAADVTGTEGTTIKIPQITTDAYGRVTSVTERTLTNKNNTYTVNNGTFTISGNGASVVSTSANASANKGINIKAGTNVTITTGSSEITIAATDTKYTAATAAPPKVATASASGTSTNYARQDHTHGIDLATGDSNGQVKIAGQNISVKGLGGAAYLNTGTTTGTVADGGHNHNGTYAKNAFSRIAVNSTNVDADSTGDTFTITAGTFVSLTGDATNDKMTIGVSTGTSSTTLARGDHQSHYWANLQTSSAANYITEPEIKSVKINGSSTNAASTNNCQIQYDTTNKCLKFLFN